MITVNLIAPLYLSRALMRHWLDLPASVHSGSSGQGKRDQKVNLDKRILMISSISGLVNMTPQKQVAYNASKGGLTMAAKVSRPISACLRVVVCRPATRGQYLSEAWRLICTVIGR